MEGERPLVYDRDGVIAAIDREAMVGLADELLGAHRGSERSPSWRCPNPDHPQSGRTPPLHVFDDRLDRPRWKCHGCGEGGTVIDLVMQAKGMSAREAMAELSLRTGTPPLRTSRRRRGSPPRTGHPPGGPEPISPFACRVVPAIDEYVDACAAALWRPEGSSVRRWLTGQRRLTEAVLRVNRVGVDLGTAKQSRPDGIPAVRRAVVLPVLVAGGACFVQLRILNGTPHFPKYLNAQDTLAPNPHLAMVRPAPVDRLDSRREVLVTEGLVDALTVAGTGYRAVAFLGASHPNQRAALAIARLPGRLLVAFDADPAGQAGADRLVRLLAAQRREAAVLRLPRGSDLNSCAVASQDWSVELAARIEHATYALSRLPAALVER